MPAAVKKNDLSKHKEDHLNVFIDALLDKKAQNVIALDLSTIEGTIVPYFIICSADSTVHVRALSENVEEDSVKKLQRKPIRRQGMENSLWIILDYGDVMIHIMETQTREFYQLERLWADASLQKFNHE